METCCHVCSQYLNFQIYYVIFRKESLAFVQRVGHDWVTNPFIFHMCVCICIYTFWSILNNISSVQFSHIWLFVTPWIAARQASCPSPTPGVHPNSRPSSPWCHPAISSSVIPFSSWTQSLPASESFPMSQIFAWGSHSTGASALASFLPKKSQGWSPSEWIGWISLQSKGLSRVFSNTTVQKH